MTKTMEDWERDFQAILFAGYFCEGTDAATRYRKMANDAARLRALMKAFKDDIQPPAPLPAKPAVQNGSTTPAKVTQK